MVHGLARANEKMLVRVRSLVFENILRQPVGWFDLEGSSPGILANRLARSVPLIKSALGSRVGVVIAYVVTIVATSIIAIACGWKLALCIVLMVPVIVALAIMQEKVRVRNVTRDSTLMDNAGRIAAETIRNIRTVQALDQQQLFVDMFKKNLDAPLKEGKAQALVFGILSGLTSGFMSYVYAVAFRVGGYLVEIDEMNSENMYRVFFALSLCTGSIASSFSYMQDYSKARHAIRLLNFLFTRKSEIDSSSSHGAKPDILGAVEFRDVHFSYPNRPTVRVLRGLNVSLAAGKTLAIVGESGCGKSTIISLLERFYNPDSGTIVVDGYDISTLNLTYLRSKIGLVTQEPILFDASIRENIAYGVVSLQEYVFFDQIEQAAQTANIHDFIMSLPDKYDTMVGKRGVQLSGGQKQRIAIARALIRNPKILLLDEATSALDTESEKVVQAALDEAKVGRTCILVAHRLSTVRNADLICVMQKGKIVEQGTHEELEALRGEYFQLTQRQTFQ